MGELLVDAVRLGEHDPTGSIALVVEAQEHDVVGGPGSGLVKVSQKPSGAGTRPPSLVPPPVLVIDGSLLISTRFLNQMPAPG